LFLVAEEFSLSYQDYTYEVFVEEITKNDSISCFSELPVLYYQK
jgi:hypothetical protein